MSKAVQVKRLSPSKLKANPDNPRHIAEHKFEALKKSIGRFEKMLDARPDRDWETDASLEQLCS